jgi:hypothetical protein
MVRLWTVLSVTGMLWLWTAEAEAEPVDTARLAAELKAVRGKQWLAAEYAGIQTHYLEWIDARLRAGQAVQSMNRELKAAGLFPPSASGTLPDLGSYAGYLEEISTLQIKSASDLLALKARIYRGANCGLDDTVILYQRQPLRRLALLNGDPDNNKYAFYIAGLDAGEENASGERLVASGWVASNCSSTWNTKRIRIDRLDGLSIKNVLARNLWAQDRDKGENVAAWIRGNVATFWYNGGVGDGDLLSRPAVARYRVAENRAVRDNPVALTRAGFISEWLHMSDFEAARWSEPAAARARSAVAQDLEHHTFEWARMGRCAGSPQIWEAGVRIDGSKKLYVFRVSGSRATELRMLAVTDKWTESCAPLVVQDGLSTVGAELPW